MRYVGTSQQTSVEDGLDGPEDPFSAAKSGVDENLWPDRQESQKV